MRCQARTVTLELFQASKEERNCNEAVLDLSVAVIESVLRCLDERHQHKHPSYTTHKPELTRTIYQVPPAPAAGRTWVSWLR